MPCDPCESLPATMVPIPLILNGRPNAAAQAAAVATPGSTSTGTRPPGPRTSPLGLGAARQLGLSSAAAGLGLPGLGLRTPGPAGQLPAGMMPVPGGGGGGGALPYILDPDGDNQLLAEVREGQAQGQSRQGPAWCACLHSPAHSIRSTALVLRCMLEQQS